MINQKVVFLEGPESLRIALTPEVLIRIKKIGKEHYLVKNQGDDKTMNIFHCETIYSALDYVNSDNRLKEIIHHFYFAEKIANYYNLKGPLHDYDDFIHSLRHKINKEMLECLN